MFCKNLLESSGFLPKEIAKIKSPFNGEIIITQKGGKNNILVSGLSQSGPQVEGLWKKALSKVKISPKEILILGLGGGNLVDVINKKWPSVIVEAVEIDPEMIKIANEYFGIDQERAIVILGDAVEIVKKPKFKDRLFELIFVDLFLGEKYPGQAESDSFLNDLKKLVEDEGIIIFNRLYFGDHKKNTRKFISKLQKTFGQVRFYKSDLFFPSNLLIFCKKLNSQ